jgi:hypothetical protein
MTIQSATSSTRPVLPDGAPLPDKPASLILSFFATTSSLDLRSILDRSLIRALLAHVEKKAPNDATFEAAVTTLITRGMLEETSGPPRRTPALPAMLGAHGLIDRKYKAGDPCYVLTGLGRKASILAHSEPWGIGLWSIGSERLTDQVLATVNSSPGSANFVTIDAHCCLVPEDEVRKAISHLLTNNFIEENGPDEYCLTETGAVRAAELSGEIHQLWQQSIAAVTQNASLAPEFDLSFIVDVSLREVLERNASELSHALSFKMHTATIVLSGAIGEGVLYHALVSRKPRAMASTRAPQKAGAPTDPEFDKLGWSLSKCIDVAIDMGLLRATVGSMAHSVLREFRNMIHPKLQVDRKLFPDATVAEASVHCLKALLDDIRSAAP